MIGKFLKKVLNGNQNKIQDEIPVFTLGRDEYERTFSQLSDGKNAIAPSVLRGEAIKYEEDLFLSTTRKEKPFITVYKSDEKFNVVPLLEKQYVYIRLESNVRVGTKNTKRFYGLVLCQASIDKQIDKPYYVAFNLLQPTTAITSLLNTGEFIGKNKNLLERVLESEGKICLFFVTKEEYKQIFLLPSVYSIRKTWPLVTVYNPNENTFVIRNPYKIFSTEQWERGQKIYIQCADGDDIFGLVSAEVKFIKRGKNEFYVNIKPIQPVAKK